MSEKQDERLTDSGGRESFMDGAVRELSPERPRPDLISPFFEEVLGTHLMKGGKKYAPRNWEKGIPQSRHWESLRRHMMQEMQGLDDEDHLAAMACNIMFLIHNREAIKNGILPEHLDDMPNYLRGLNPNAV